MLLLVKPLEGENKHARIDKRLGAATRNVNREYYLHTPLSLALTEEKAIRLYEAVKEETAIVAKETGFQEFSGDAILELLESRSVILMKKEPAGLDRPTYKGSQDYHGHDKSVTSEENTLTIKTFKRNFQQN
jgi:hypothetical protein